MIAQQELDSGEPLLWAGRGSPGRLAMKGIPATLFGIPFTAFSIFWMYMAAGQRVPDVSGGRITDYFWLWGLPFFAVGCGMLLVPLWLYWQGTRTVYAVTDRRALIITGERSRTVKSIGPADAARVERKEHGDGTGDLVFESADSVDQRRRPQRMPTGFFGIFDARSVEQFLMSLSQKEGRSSF